MQSRWIERERREERKHAHLVRWRRQRRQEEAGKTPSRTERPVLRAFERLLRNAMQADLACMINFKDMENWVSVHDHHERSADQSCGAPWLAAWDCGRYNRNTRFVLEFDHECVLSWRGWQSFAPIWSGSTCYEEAIRCQVSGFVGKCALAWRCLLRHCRGSVESYVVKLLDEPRRPRASSCLEWGAPLHDHQVCAQIAKKQQTDSYSRRQRERVCPSGKGRHRTHSQRGSRVGALPRGGERHDDALRPRHLRRRIRFGGEDCEAWGREGARGNTSTRSTCGASCRSPTSHVQVLHAARQRRVPQRSQLCQQPVGGVVALGREGVRGGVGEGPLVDVGCVRRLQALKFEP